MTTPIGPGPLVYAHRGASAHATDNSIEAFELAAAAGADGVELDVRRTRDGVLILAHDPVHPTIGPLAAATLEEIRDRDPEIATLREGMQAIPRSMFVNVEIKNHRMDPGFDASRGIADQTIEELRSYDDMSRLLFTSFDPLTTRRVKRVDQDLLTGQLVTGKTLLGAALSWAGRHDYETVNLDRSLLAQDPHRVVDRARKRGLVVVVWTVDDPTEMRILFRAGVGAVITNDPAVGRRVVDDL